MLIDVSGRPFPSFMRETVLQPTRMDGSTFEQPLPVALRAEAATAHDASGKPVPGRYHTYPEMAAAGLWTTPGDLARFAIEIQQALAGRSKVLSAATAREMLTTQMVPYGLGVTLGGTGRAERFSHGGSNEGFECQMVAFAELGQGAVVMTNGQGGGRLAAELLRAIAHEYAWPDYGRVREKTVARIDPAIYQSYAGRYEMGPDHIVILKIVAGKLILVDGKQTIELLPESETKFFELVEESEIEFIKGPDGTVTGAVINGRTKARRLGPGGRP
jgi:CubicO group peptidase (beta-lactamase class C family)